MSYLVHGVAIEQDAARCGLPAAARRRVENI